MHSYSSAHFRTWIEINKKATRRNLEALSDMVGKNTAVMAVIKSNAYGHGLVLMARLLAENKAIWLGVDSITEALRLRREGIKNPILVLGATLPARMAEAAAENIILTISNFESFDYLRKLKKKPEIHIKIDTGMHRQGFLPEDIAKLISKLKKHKITPAGIYTHFASAKDAAYPTFTLEQFSVFKKVLALLAKAGFKNLVRHASASGGTILYPETHLDMVRIGMSLYGYWPSLEAKIQKLGQGRLNLSPALSWYTYIMETKNIKKGSYVGYDLTERVNRDSKIAVLPIGYWHGYDRGLSGTGEVLLKGKRVKVLGRISMDMVVIDITDVRGVKVGDKVTLIGKDKKEEIWADELGQKISTSQYEFLTRINPLIKRIVI